MLRIYVNDNPLFLAQPVSPQAYNYLSQPSTAVFNELTPENVKNSLFALESGNVGTVIFFQPDVQRLLDAFRTHLTVVTAAGGLVLTEQNEALLIFRRGKWDLPKGKLDEGEDLASCALREIGEETGVSQLEIVQPLTTTYHTYYQGTDHILKESHWYLMKTREKGLLKPQTEEDIERCEWVPWKKLSAYKNNMHASILDVLDEGERFLQNK